jgi:nicotinamidase/pyrazinamidase
VIPKTRYSGFFQTKLGEELSQRGVTALILTGVVTNICILYTAADAISRGYRVQVPEDSVMALSSEDQKWALRQLRTVLRVEVV